MDETFGGPDARKLHVLEAQSAADPLAWPDGAPPLLIAPEHRAFWAAEIGYDATEAPFGENLSTFGITEDEARIGDIWQWGAAKLQICQPRWPCYKLALHSGRVDMIKRFVASGRCGWYLRVLEEGMAPVAGPIVQETCDPLRISVAMAFAAASGELGAEDVERVKAHPLLAEAWRR